MSEPTAELVRALLETVHDAILVVDERGRIEMTNERAERLFGFAPGQLVGRNVEELVPGDVRPAHERYMASYLAAPRPRPMGEGLDVRARRADGTTIPVDIALSTFEGGRGLRVSVTVRERAAPAQSRFTSAGIDEAGIDAARRLAQVVSHDINNQLGVIFNATSLLLSDLPTGSASREDVASIRAAAERAAEITRRLGSFAARGAVRIEELDFGALLSEVAAEVTGSVPAGTSVETRIERGLWHIRADGVHLREALAAIAENAIEALPAGGLITLQASNVQISGADARLVGGLPPGPYVRVTVSDDGVGMAPEIAARAFEPFFTTKRGGDAGAGLGLARVSATAKETGGLATIYSEPSIGTSVRLFLPAVAPKLAAEALRAGAGEVVLVVEDDGPLRALTRLVLRRGGYLVLDAGDADEALHILSDRATRIDLLLTDLGMPGISGRELAVRARARRPDLRVIFASGYPTDVLLGRGEIEPGTVLLEKPFTDAALLSTVAAALGRNA